VDHPPRFELARALVTKSPKLTRRHLLCIVVLVLALVTDAFLIEPRWVALRKLNLASPSTQRIVFFSDIHYKGNKGALVRIVRQINSLSPDLVCFGGDIVEDAAHLDEALSILSQIESPLFGVPGNHEYWSNSSFDKIAACFQCTGGRWLVNENVLAEGVLIVGSEKPKVQNDTLGATKKILLSHYPEVASSAQEEFNLILAGHSHGGQIRLPFLGAPVLPDGVGKYDRGLFQTPSGPLYVTTGLGTWFIPIRFCCRPEIVLIEW